MAALGPRAPEPGEFFDPQHQADLDQHVEPKKPRTRTPGGHLILGEELPKELLSRHGRLVPLEALDGAVDAALVHPTGERAQLPDARDHVRAVEQRENREWENSTEEPGRTNEGHHQRDARQCRDAQQCPLATHPLERPLRHTSMHIGERLGWDHPHRRQAREPALRSVLLALARLRIHAVQR
jgi:hypothetical protein